jgi:multidrug resistance efflux pump
MVRITAVIFSVLLLLAGGAALWLRSSSPTEEHVVGRGPVFRVALGRARVESVRADASAAFPFAGRIESVTVREGDVVQPGQILAVLDAEEVRLKATEARADLNEAEAREHLLRQGPRPEAERQAEARIARAEAVLRQARIALQAAEAPPTPPASVRSALERADRDIRRMELELSLARNAKALLEAGAAESRRIVAAREADLAKIEYEGAVEKEKAILQYDRYLKEYQKVELRYSVLKAKHQWDAAQARFDMVRAKPQAEEVKAAELRIQTAEVGLDVAKVERRRLEHPDVPSPADESELNRRRAEVDAAEAVLRECREALAELKAGPRESDLALVAAGRERAAAMLSRVEKEAQRAVLTSPFAGMVVAVHAAPGSWVSPGVPILVLREDARLRLHVEIDSRVLSDVKTGMSVRVKLRAAPDVELRALVERIGSDVGSRRLFGDDPSEPRGGEAATVKVSFEEPAEDGPARRTWEMLCVGMRADAAILLEGRDDVVRVPVGFVAHDAEDRPLVWRATAQGLRAESVRVQVGMRDEHFVEITQNLKDGDIIVRPTPKR